MLVKTSFLIMVLFFAAESLASSTCYGTTSSGRLENGCKLPMSGTNFQSYSSVLSVAGRTYVHCKVKDVVDKDLKIDYEAMAAHIAALKHQAKKQAVGIWRVIFDPKMQSALTKTKSWPEIADLAFSVRRSWVRHDDHYHIDFDLPCKKM